MANRLETSMRELAQHEPGLGANMVSAIAASAPSPLVQAMAKLAKTDAETGPNLVKAIQAQRPER